MLPSRVVGLNAAVVTLVALTASAAPLAPLPAQDPRTPWPTLEWPVEHPLPRDVDRRALELAVDAAFRDPDPARPARTRAVLVVHRGRIVAERYAAGFDARSRFPAWSAAKSVLNALLGILARDGVLDVSAPAPVREWQKPGDRRHAITIDQLLRMSSGLEWSEDYTNPLASDVLSMLFGAGRHDMASFAASKRLVDAPGTRFTYSSGTSLILSRIVGEAATGGRKAADDDFPERRLFRPLGMSSAVLERDAAGTFVGSSYLFATARDLARFGLLYLRDGVWEGSRLLPDGWVDYSRTPTPASLQGQYGAHFWLNSGRAGLGVPPPMPSLPPDLFYAWGKDGQYVVIVPSRDLVVVRLGVTPLDGRWSLEPFLREMLLPFPVVGGSG